MNFADIEVRLANGKVIKQPCGSRLLLSSEALGRLPFTFTNPWEIHETETHWDYNPTYFYPREVILVGGEVGHDSVARYVIPNQ